MIEIRADPVQVEQVLMNLFWTHRTALLPRFWAGAPGHVGDPALACRVW